MSRPWPAEIDARMAEMAERYGVTVPPPVYIEMGIEVLALDMEAQRLTISMPVEARYQNPLGYMQGGIVAAAIDNAIGPLSFLVAPPSVTRELTVRYRRPVRPTLSHIVVVAELAARDGTALTFRATVSDPAGRALAEAEAHHVIVGRERGGA